MAQLRFLQARASDELISAGFHSGFERACLGLGLAPAVDATANPWLAVGKVLSRARLLRPLVRNRRSAILGLVGAVSEFRWFPYAYTVEPIPWCFDCWPHNFERWRRFFVRHRVRFAAFTARAAMAYFRERLPTLRCEWFPEACDPDDFDGSRKLASRSIDVIEHGRQYGAFHSALVGGLGRGVRHVFADRPGAVLFKTMRELQAALCDSKIAICVPRTLTHPEQAGSVETVTYRYFEVMAAGCIPVGVAPRELCDLFGFNPVVEATPETLASTVTDIIAQPGKYDPLVARNLARLREVGTWRSRMTTLLEWLKRQGFEAPSD
jgi:hypothetical protein